MGQGRTRRARTERLGIFFTDRVAVVAGLDLGGGTPELTWATTAPLRHGAVIDGVIRDLRAVSASLARADLPTCPTVVAVPADGRSVGADGVTMAHAVTSLGVSSMAVRNRVLIRLQQVLDRAGLDSVGWVAVPHAELTFETSDFDDPESINEAGVDLRIPIGAALWEEPEKWPADVDLSLPRRGWRVARVG